MMHNLKKSTERSLNIFLGTPAILWQVCFLFVPGLLLVLMSFYVPGIGITGEAYTSLIDLSHARVILRSLLFALFNASLCVVVAYPVAYYIARYVRRSKSIWLFFLTLPFWVNFLIHVYSWFFVLERNGVLNTILINIGLISAPIHFMNTFFTIGLVMFHTYLPFMVLPLYMMVEKLNDTLIEASDDLGATTRQTFMRVTLPLTLPGAQVGFFLVFILSYGEFIIPTLLGGGKTLFVGTLISEYFLLTRDNAAGSAFTMLNVLVLLWALISIYWGFKYAYRRIGRGRL